MLPGGQPRKGTAMGDHQTGKPGRTAPFPSKSGAGKSIADKLVSLLAVASICGLSGCASSGSEHRLFTFKPSRLSPSVAVSRFIVPSASFIASRKSINELPQRDRSDIQLTSDQKIITSEKEADADKSESTLSKSSGASGTDVHPESADSVNVPGMSLEQLESLALENNPTLSQAQAAVSGQYGSLIQSGLYPNPQIGYLNGSASRSGVKQSNGLFASQEFVTAHKLQLAQLAASEELRRFQWDSEAQRMRVLNDLKIRYFEVLGAQELVAVNRELVGIAKKTLDAAEQLRLNETTKQDVLQAEFQLESARLNLDDAEFRHDAAWEQLSTIIGITTLTPTPLTGDLACEIPLLDLDQCWRELLEKSPQLRATESELGHGLATLREAHAQAIPNVTVQTVAEYDRVTQATTVSTLVALPLPIHNRNQGNIDKAAADILADRADICRVQLVLRDQLADSFRRYRTSRRQSERLHDSILKNSEAQLNLTQQLFANGQISLAPVLAAQQTFFHNKIAYVEARTELNKVVAEIQGLQLTGGLNPAAIGSAIQNQPGGGAQRQRALLNEIQDRASKQLLPAAQIGQ